MKLPFKYIAILVIMSLTAIFAYQSYWLVNMYHTEKGKADADILFAIRNADHIELFVRVDSVSAAEDKKKHVVNEGGTGDNRVSYSISFERDEAPDTLITEFNREIKMDSTTNVKKEKIQRSKRQEEVNVGEGYKSIEMMALQTQRGLHSAVDEAIGGINLAKFDSILNSDLEKANLHVKHYTQVMYLPNDSILKSSLPAEMDTQKLTRYEHIYDIHNEHAYYVYVEPIGTIILKQMAGILSSSFIILIILGFSFWYLIRTIMKQKTLDEMKSDFTNNITHELKTPIAVAYAANDALLNFNQAQDKVKRDKYLNIAQEQLQKLSGLVEQILSMSMEQRKTFRLNPEEVQLKPLISSLIEQHKLKANKKVVIQTDLNNDDLTVLTDRAHFSNIISNLIDNAIKYSGEEVFITIRSRMKEDKLELSVSDNGIGISAEKQKHIFDKFYRVPTGNLHNVKGYGLGLFYVKTMIEKLGGTIDVESETGKGSTFIILL
ncbi:MAG: HAMP domain-containing histidine kinase [Bacteroides sp.]|nr:HAMP domain-containing histidine kinase [Bacteroides sp.]